MHQVVLEQLHLIGCERDADVAADAGVDAVDALAAREEFLEADAPRYDAGTRGA
jgi:hypothetical protein